MTKDNKTILGWCFYDFANSAFTTIVVTFIYSAFFSDYIVGDSSIGQVYWGNAVTICAIIIALLSPMGEYLSLLDSIISKNLRDIFGPNTKHPALQGLNYIIHKTMNVSPFHKKKPIYEYTTFRNI